MTPDFCRLMAKYNSWQNGNIMDRLPQIRPEDYTRDMGSFFGNIHMTLNHLLAGDRAWLTRFQGKFADYRAGQVMAETAADFPAVRRALDREISDWADAVTQSQLDAHFSFTSVTYKKDFSGPLWHFVAQFFNHQTHHRSQVTTMMQILGIDYGVTDIPVMPGRLPEPSS